MASHVNASRIPIFSLFLSLKALLRSQTFVKEREAKIFHRVFYSKPRERLTHPYIFFHFKLEGPLRSQTPVKEGEPKIFHRVFYSKPCECLTHPNIFSIFKLEGAFKIANTCKGRGA